MDEIACEECSQAGQVVTVKNNDMHTSMKSDSERTTGTEEANQPLSKPSSPARQQKGWRHRDAVRLLRDMIVTGELQPGARLREVAISEQLDMSRTPVREAFRTLAAEGLVELLPNRSVVVTQLDEREAQDVFVVLGALEALAAEQAAERMTDSQIDELGELQEEMERQFEDQDRVQYTITNRIIHERLVEGSGNAFLVRAWRSVLPSAERARRLNMMDRGRWAVAVLAHRRIYSALRARDGQALRGLMLEHFNQDKIQQLGSASISE
jgi:DNA-binding GntR family transcriptional regulator